jgi:predicted nuclease of predicted toxin-antitoxin system
VYLLIFTADENIDREIVEELRKNQYSVIYICDYSPGISDDEVLDISNKNMSILLTSDKDFGEMVFQQKKNTSGVILLRLHGLDQNEKAKIVLKAIKEHLEEFKNSFSVITKKLIRIRKMKQNNKYR